MSNAVKDLNILVTSLSVLHNYFCSQQNFFSDKILFVDLYLAKFLDTLMNPFFLYAHWKKFLVEKERIRIF